MELARVVIKHAVALAANYLKSMSSAFYPGPFNIFSHFPSNIQRSFAVSDHYDALKMSFPVRDSNSTGAISIGATGIDHTRRYRTERDYRPRGAGAH